MEVEPMVKILKIVPLSPSDIIDFCLLDSHTFIYHPRSASCSETHHSKTW